MRIAVCVCSLPLFLLSACGRSSEKPAKAEEHVASTKAATRSGNIVRLAPGSPQLTRIRVAAVENVEVPTAELIAPGKVELNPSHVSRVSLPVPGRIRQLQVGLGDRVQQGQPLLSLESPEVSAVQSALRQGEAYVSQARVALAKAQADLARVRDLLSNRAVAQKEVLAAETVVAQSEAALEQALASRDEAQRRLRLLGLEAGSQDQSITLRAPVSGKVVEVSAAAGEYRNDTAAPVLTLADLSTVWVAADVPENSIRLIQMGEPVEIALAAYPGETFTGRVKQISDLLDPQTRTVKVRAALANKSGRFRPEMFATIRHSHGKQSAIVIPKSALLQQEGRNVVYVERGPGQFQEVPVTIVWQGTDRIAIESGISRGDRVVVDGVMLLKGAAL
jgi:cobalt-zinc-cadmium efflux system membrane fusion protein